MNVQILCVCVTIGENPLIRYHRPLDIKETINRRIPEQLAKIVQSELDNFCATNPEFPVSTKTRKYIGMITNLLNSLPEILHFLQVH